MRGNPIDLSIEPEVQLIVAVYLRAKYGLSAKSERLRTQARLFFEADGWDVSKIKVKNARKTTRRPA